MEAAVVVIIVGDEVQLWQLVVWRHGGTCEWCFVLKLVPHWLQVETPHSGASGLAKAIEDDFPIFVDDGNGVHREGDGAVGVAEDTHAEEIVDKVGHDVHAGRAKWEVGEIWRS